MTPDKAKSLVNPKGPSFLLGDLISSAGIAEWGWQMAQERILIYGAQPPPPHRVPLVVKRGASVFGYGALAVGSVVVVGLTFGAGYLANKGASAIETLVAERVVVWGLTAGRFVEGVVGQVEATAQQFAASSSRALLAVGRLSKAAINSLEDIGRTVAEGAKAIFSDMMRVISGVAEGIARFILPHLEEVFQAIVDFAEFIMKELVHIIGCFILNNQFVIDILKTIGIILNEFVKILHAVICAVGCFLCSTMGFFSCSDLPGSCGPHPC